MENLIGVAKSYIEEKGIDTTNLTTEEIIQKYYELLEEPNVSEEKEETELDELLNDYKEIIDSLNDEQLELFKKLIELIK